MHRDVITAIHEKHVFFYVAAWEKGFWINKISYLNVAEVLNKDCCHRLLTIHIFEQSNTFLSSKKSINILKLVHSTLLFAPLKTQKAATGFTTLGLYFFSVLPVTERV